MFFENRITRHSQLLTVDIDKGAGNLFDANYTYHDDGNMNQVTENGDTSTRTYDGDILTGATGTPSFSLTWDKNGRMVAGLNNTSITWNWDHRLRSATIGSDGISCKYSHDGAMASKAVTGAAASNHKFIVDRIGDIPVVLLVLDADDSDAIVKSYYHALGQTLAQRDGGYNADKYFYLQDRLGSVRQVVHYNSGTGSVDVDNRYTYDPFGNPIASEIEHTVDKKSDMDIGLTNIQSNGIVLC